MMNETKLNNEFINILRLKICLENLSIEKIETFILYTIDSWIFKFIAHSLRMFFILECSPCISFVQFQRQREAITT